VSANTPIDNAAYLSSFPNAAPTAAPVTVASAAGANSNSNSHSNSNANSGSMPGDFRSLFQVGERSQPVSPAVHKLWGEQGSLVASAVPAATASTPQGLDLFSDRSGAFSS
jgi:hypothetical protein